MARHRCVQACVQAACAHTSSQPTQETQAGSDGKNPVSLLVLLLHYSMSHSPLRFPCDS